MKNNGNEVTRGMHTEVPDAVEAVCDIGKGHVYEFKLNAEKFASRSSGEPSSIIISRRATRAATKEQEGERGKAKRNATHALARGVTRLRWTQCLAYFLQVNILS